jgi:hypothetical protein
MIVLELSKDRVYFKFWEFTKVSGAVALATWLAGTAVLIAYGLLIKF